MGSFLAVLGRMLLNAWGRGLELIRPVDIEVDPYQFGLVYVGSTAYKSVGFNVKRAINVSGWTAVPQPVFGVVDADRLPVGRMPPGTHMVATFSFSPTQDVWYYGNAGPTNGGKPMVSTKIRGRGIIRHSEGGIALGDGDLEIGKALEFGDVLINSSYTREVELRNGLPDTIIVEVLWFHGDRGFKVVEPVATRIEVSPGGTVKVKIEFTPIEVGNAADGVTFQDVDGRIIRAGTAVSGRGITEDARAAGSTEERELEPPRPPGSFPGRPQPFPPRGGLSGPRTAPREPAVTPEDFEGLRPIPPGERPN
jgi:hypothetical protein